MLRQPCTGGAGPSRTAWGTVAGLVGAALGALAAPLAGACGEAARADVPADAGSTGADAATALDGGDGGPAVSVLHPDAAPLAGEAGCTVVITTGIVPEPAKHLPFCTPIEYPTNPPSGGPHWAQWAAFGVSESPVPREMYVHDMEHGSVVLAYRCEGPCPDVRGALAHVASAQPADPRCDRSVHDRLLTTPDPLLDTPIAAAAWGATYTATCIDEASLRAFIDAHYARSPENECAQGLELGDAGYASCDASPAGR